LPMSSESCATSACPAASARRASPNISSTIWRTVADQKNNAYYFYDTARPSLAWGDAPPDRLQAAPGRPQAHSLRHSRTGRESNDAL
jgi:penicillin V acylase-like amidase (Ntn superfamily)